MADLQLQIDTFVEECSSKNNQLLLDGVLKDLNSIWEYVKFKDG